MSILIKGIDLPKDIDELRLIINGMSIAINPTEAIQIPTPHGDIKDINTVEDELDERCGQLSAEIVRNAPTILEAEE